MNRFTDRVAIVTGAGGGLGEASAKRLAREGARVIVADIRETDAARVAAEIESGGGVALPCRADISLEDDVRAMVGRAVDAFGRLDLMHNNAAATSHALVARDGKIADMPLDVWDQTMSVNLRGAMLGCKHAIPAMIAGGGGSIVNMSSISARMGGDIFSAYGVSKAALEALTRYVASQYGKERIRCNAVLPATTLTTAVKEYLSPELLALSVSGLALPELAEPEDVIGVVAFLLSDEARHMTGQSLCVDGGFTLTSASAAILKFAQALP